MTYKCPSISFQYLIRKIKVFLNLLFSDYISNHYINKIPFYAIRHFYYRNVVGLKMGKGSSIHLNTYIRGSNIVIGENTVINRQCNLSGKGSLVIGSNTSISQSVYIVTADHDVHSDDFALRYHNINIGNYVFVGSRATIIGNVTIGDGSVICAGAIVTKDVKEYTIVAGIPAKPIGIRRKDLKYNPKWMGLFD